MEDDFSKEPISISEARGIVGKGGASPRDVLVNLLRSVDKGECDIDHLIVIYTEKRPDGLFEQCINRSIKIGDRYLVSLGLLESAKDQIVRSARD